MKRTLLFFVFVVGLSVVNAGTASGQTVVRLDPALDEFISPDTKLELVRNGFGIAEGPNWVQKGNTGYLVFSDIAANVIFKMSSDGQQLSVLVDHSGYTGFDPWNVGVEKTNGKDPSDPLFRRYIQTGSNGITLDREGRLIVCTFIGRSVVRIEKNGTRTILADHYDGKGLRGPNDVVVKRDGAIYFTDEEGGSLGRGRDPKEELTTPGIYMIKDGEVTFAVKDIPTPNGLVFSPDEKYFYANGSSANYIRRYDVQPDDTLTNGQMFIDMSGDKAPGLTDGMRVDSKGNIYTTGPGGIWIISPEGKPLGTILIPNVTATNLSFGDADFRTLYITDRTSIYKIRLKTPGHQVF